MGTAMVHAKYRSVWSLSTYSWNPATVTRKAPRSSDARINGTTVRTGIAPPACVSTGSLGEGSDMSEDAVKRARDPGEIQRLHQQGGVLCLSAGACAHEAPELLRHGSSLLARLLLEGPKRSKLPLTLDDPLDGG